MKTQGLFSFDLILLARNTLAMSPQILVASCLIIPKVTQKGRYRPLKRKVRKVREEATATLCGRKSDEREENVYVLAKRLYPDEGNTMKLSPAEDLIA